MIKKSISKGVDRARFWVKYKLEGDYLPSLPESVFEQLFFQGRTAWNYKYSETVEKEGKNSDKITFKIIASLKKEFHELFEEHRFSFSVRCIHFPETCKLKIIKITSIE